MTRQEHLLTLLVEECCETAQRATKALRFGLEEIQEGQNLTNAERIREEFNHIVAAFEMLDIGYVDRYSIETKMKKVNKFLEYSKEVGTLV